MKLKTWFMVAILIPLVQADAGNYLYRYDGTYRGVTKSQLQEYLKLWVKSKLTNSDYSQIAAVYGFDLTIFEMVELVNHIRDCGDQSLRDSIDANINSKDEKIFLPRLSVGLELAQKLDRDMVAYAKNNTKIVDAMPSQLRGAFDKIHHSTIDCVKETITENNSSRLHAIEEYLDVYDNTQPIPPEFFTQSRSVKAQEFGEHLGSSNLSAYDLKRYYDLLEKPVITIDDVNACVNIAKKYPNEPESNLILAKLLNDGTAEAKKRLSAITRN